MFKFVKTVVVGLLSLVGCSREEGSDSGGGPTPSSVVNFVVGVVGDRTRIDLLATLGKTAESSVRVVNGIEEAILPSRGKNVLVIAAQDDSTEKQAEVAWRSDLVLFAMDATKGPLPITRENVLLAKQMEVPGAAIVLTNSNAVSDPELLELEELEMRDLLNKYAWPGDTAICASDHSAAPVRDLRGFCRGPKELTAYLGTTPRRSQEINEPNPAEVPLSVYTLAVLEAFPISTEPGLRSGPVDLLAAGKRFKGSLDCPKTIGPAETGRCTLRWYAERPSVSFRKLVILKDGHIFAAGAKVRQANSR
jgi:hypothetical protein